MDKTWFNYIDQFDIVSLVETHLDDNVDVSDLFTSFELFTRPAIKLSVQGRRSGGVMVLVKKKLCHLVEEVNMNYCNVVVLRLNKQLFESHRDIFYIATYIPPMGSPFYNLNDSYSYLDDLDNCIEDLYEQENLSVLICGDLNARTSNCQVTCDLDNQNDNELYDKSCIFVNNRISLDEEINAFGKLLLEMCWCHDMFIVNGNPQYDTLGQYTYLSSHGHSVVDYFISSSDLSFLVQELKVEDNIASDHMPVVLLCNKMSCNERVIENEAGDVNVSAEKYVWCASKAADVREKLVSNEFKAKIIEAEHNMSLNIDQAVNKFTEALLDTATDMKKKITYSKDRALHNAKWFDKECWEQKKKVNGLLKKHRKCRSEESYSNYEKDIYIDVYYKERKVNLGKQILNVW